MPWSEQRHRVSAIPVQTILRSSLLRANLFPFNKELAPKSGTRTRFWVAVFFFLEEKNQTHTSSPPGNID